jgi:hypothetical protein
MQAIEDGVAAIALLAAGVLFLSRPDKMQNWALKGIDKGWGRYYPFRGYIESPRYLWHIRAIGLIAILMGTFAACLSLGIFG